MAQGHATYCFNKESIVSASVQTILVKEGEPEETKRQGAKVLGIAMDRMEEK